MAKMATRLVYKVTGYRTGDSSAMVYLAKTENDAERQRGIFAEWCHTVTVNPMFL